MKGNKSKWNNCCFCFVFSIKIAVKNEWKAFQHKLNYWHSCCSSVTSEGFIVQRGCTVFTRAPLTVIGNPTKLLYFFIIALILSPSLNSAASSRSWKKVGKIITITVIATQTSKVSKQKILILKNESWSENSERWKRKKNLKYYFNLYLCSTDDIASRC